MQSEVIVCLEFALPAEKRYGMATRENFSGRLSVILAMAGSAIGLGNIWRFPYLAGEQGGATFVFAYILATIFITLPIFLSEVIIGRRSRSNASDAMGLLAPKSRFWGRVGILAVLIPTIINSYYSVIGGWSLDYMIKSMSPGFFDASPEEVADVFRTFISSPWEPVATHLVFLGISVLIVAGGVKTGIEKFSRIILPVLFLLVIVIAVYSISLPGAMDGVRYLFKPDFSKLSPETFAYAMGQSFYSMSVGMGAIITYGSYVSKDENIMASSAFTGLSDLGFALLAGLAIMPAVFAAGIEPGSGPGLIFQSVPYIFAEMGSGVPLLSAVVSTFFFLAVVVAAMTSCVSLIEVGVAWLMERFGMRRATACKWIFAICGILGILCSLSFGPLGRFRIAGRTLFDLFDWTSSNILLLLMGLLAVVFVGHVMNRKDVFDEITNSGTARGNVKLFGIFFFLVRWVCPAAVIVIFLFNFLG